MRAINVVMSLSLWASGCSFALNRPDQPNTCSEGAPLADFIATPLLGIAAAVAGAEGPDCRNGAFECEAEKTRQDSAIAFFASSAAVFAASAIYGTYRATRPACGVTEAAPTIAGISPDDTESNEARDEATSIEWQAQRTKQEVPESSTLAHSEETSDTQNAVPNAEQAPSPRTVNIPPRVPPEREEQAITLLGHGTCFAISHDGLIATAAHVVERGDIFGVQFEGEKLQMATIIARSSAVDLAVLRIERRTSQYIKPAPQDDFRLGEKVFTIGFPVPDALGWDAKFAEGTVSGLKGLELEHFLQLSVPVQGGNSGGALLSESGQLRGVIVAKINDQNFERRTGSAAGAISFAVKGSFLTPLLETRYINRNSSALSRDQAIRLAQKASCKVLVGERR